VSKGGPVRRVRRQQQSDEAGKRRQVGGKTMHCRRATSNMVRRGRKGERVGSDTRELQSARSGLETSSVQFLRRPVTCAVLCHLRDFRRAIYRSQQPGGAWRNRLGRYGILLRGGFTCQCFTPCAFYTGLQLCFIASKLGQNVPLPDG
jgi:hypothetical protein